MKPLSILFALTVSGLFQFILSPPVSWIGFQVIAWIPAFFVFMRLNGVRALMAGWFTGTLANLSVLYWISATIDRFTQLPAAAGWAAALLVSAAAGLYLAVFAWGFARIKKVSGTFWPFSIAAWFCACEFLNPQLFPFYQGVGWYKFPYLFQIVSLAGVSGASFLVIAINGVGLQLVENRLNRTRWDNGSLLRNMGIVLLLVALTLSWSAYRLNLVSKAESNAPRLRAALVQPNIDSLEKKRIRSNNRNAVVNLLLSLSANALANDRGIKVLVWPEAILSGSLSHEKNRTILQFSKQHQVEIWTGTGAYDRKKSGSVQSFNSAFRVYEGKVTDLRYDKNILLPFGEYTPFAETFPILKQIPVPGEITPGDVIPVYHSTSSVRFVFLICYEAIISDFVSKALKENANLIVNLTNDSWFGDTSEPYQHLMLTTLQAAQHGVPLIRATSTGLSAFVDAAGIIRSQSSLFQREVLVGDIRPVRVDSPYSSWGDWFAWVCVAVSVILLGVSLSRVAQRAARRSGSG